MRISTEQQQRLANMIKAELTMATSLQEILQRELGILSGDDPEQIEAISREKLTQMRQLSQQLATRDQFLATLNLPRGKDGTDILVQQLPSEHDLCALWKQLQNTGAELEQQNRLNGSIVAISQRQTKQALDILQGKQNIPETYGPSGESCTDATPNSLAKA